MAMRVVALLALGGVALVPQAAAPPAADLAREVQAHYATVRDFSADFTQTYQGGVVRQTVRDAGKVRIKKPGRMWWDYRTNDKIQVVADGSEIYTYIPPDRKVYVTRMPGPNQASTAMLFLTGRGDILRDFTPSLGDNQTGARRLILAPQTPQADFTSLTLVVNPTTLALEGLVTTDQANGVTTYTFSNMKENAGLSDADFVFNMSKLPKDIEVIRR